MQILEFLSDKASFELGLQKTIGYFFICLSKKVLIFTEIVQSEISRCENFKIAIQMLLSWITITLHSLVVQFYEKILE